MHQLLLASGKSLCTAESCSGGRIASLITSMAGSSEYFRGGIVSYQTAIKEMVLHVDAAVIEKYGVVSREADPVGTVYISVGTATQGLTKRVVSQLGERTKIQDDVARQAIELFNKYLEVEL